jgi:hypothetical protein
LHGIIKMGREIKMDTLLKEKTQNTEDTGRGKINKFLSLWMKEEERDYFNEIDFFRIWNKAKASKEWSDFVDLWSDDNALNNYFIAIDLIDPRVFIPEWARHIGWKED